MHSTWITDENKSFTSQIFTMEKQTSKKATIIHGVEGITKISY